MSSGPGAVYIVFEQRYGTAAMEAVRDHARCASRDTGLPYRRCWIAARDAWVSLHPGAPSVRPDDVMVLVPAGAGWKYLKHDDVR